MKKKVAVKRRPRSKGIVPKPEGCWVTGSRERHFYAAVQTNSKFVGGGADNQQSYVLFCQNCGESKPLT